MGFVFPSTGQEMFHQLEGELQATARVFVYVIRLVVQELASAPLAAPR